jgi:hypothetical protein
MSKVHDRILELEVLCDESADTVQITAVNYYRNRGRLDASEPHVLNITVAALAANHECEMGDAAIPPPTHLRIVSTFQA